MEHHEADVRQVVGHGAPGDDTARFLRELRQLRDSAGLGHAELAARAHYPYDVIRAAEGGPALPELPVLSAYVRGCGGTTEEWEERWRSLTRSPSLPLSTTRQSGQSDAATAGARISSGAVAGDGPDPSIIMAALNRVAEVMASRDEAPAVPVPPVAQPAPDLPAAAPATQAPAGERAGGWDPIRVSSAWPVLEHTPTVAEPAGAPNGTGPSSAAGSSSGVGAPWGDAPTVGTRPADGTLTANGASASVAGSGIPAGGVPAGSRPGRSPRTMIVVLAVVLLCLLVALLAVFA